MSRQRLSGMAFWVAAITVILSAPAMADFFHYRDANGHLHLTNVWDRIPPAYRAQAKQNRRADGDPAPQTTQPSVTSPKAKQVATASQPDATMRKPSSKPLFSQTKPVDAHQFGLLRLRMSEHEVLRRLGAPATVMHAGSHSSPRAQGGQVIRIVQGQVWYYPGTGRTAATRLEFQNGLLVHKSREHH